MNTMHALRMFLCICILMLYGCSQPRTYVFELKEKPKLLTEELAIEKARESMSKAGFNLERWHLRKGTEADRVPDGTVDNYLERFGQTNWGRLHFTDGRKNRCVQVRLDNDRLICEVVQLP